MCENEKALTLKSAWIIKNKQHISLTDNALALPPTSKTRKSMNAVSNINIIDSNKNVNTIDKACLMISQYIATIIIVFTSLLIARSATFATSIIIFFNTTLFF